jgi:non-heme chloroperoxidase
MSYITVGQENSSTIDIYYEDLGSGQPVILIHGFPLNGHSWEKQVAVLLKAGYRVITYVGTASPLENRRGFGSSSQPSVGYDYETFTDDLHKLITTLDLRDMVLVGFSMGTGEVTRYLSKYGSERVSKAVLMAPVPPFLLKTDDNPEGVDRSVFSKIEQAIVADRPSYLSAFFANFYNVDVLGSNSRLEKLHQRITDDAIRLSWQVAAGASAKATLDCVASWLTDFRADLPRIDVPTLIIQGDADRILPIDSTGNRLPKLIKNSRLVVIPDGPHAINWTHADLLNPVLLDFLKSGN